MKIGKNTKVGTGFPAALPTTAPVATVSHMGEYVWKVSLLCAMPTASCTSLPNIACLEILSLILSSISFAFLFIALGTTMELLVIDGG